ncbi:hypothetical protein ASPZODRAFT_72797 [Penicilliopsis zonata CBS 506.65]|uniref:Metallo-beta-lactamase domain-containing protein n=1 Tax=Penicilliopsis zonata CBS 506.65 TaxID=1073090 RepID=A0A1L9S9W1_9EURO|nr:hypothetical protein ASPZODRAFT_72797 [Penicilliopsis zonata CBS 506.65]OJJ43921.1 hypothetical protein ASPZODRAFT_72797 [Penicilliopsis zonata CBS 506.65]
MSRNINDFVDLCAFEDYLTAQERLLPVLPEVEQLTERVIRILADNPGKMQLQGTNTYIVGTGQARLLIDTGEGKPRWAETIISQAETRQISFSAVLLTHWHGDHTGGVSDLLARWPTLQGRIFKNQPDRGQEAITDGQTFAVEGATVRAVHTPGHSTDHMCFVLEEDDALFTGDNLLGHGTTAVEDLAAYMATLARMQGLACRRGYPGHGALLHDLRLKLQLELGLKHRRERQIQAALVAAGRATPAQLVGAVFGLLPAPVVESVFQPFMTQLLLKLAGENRVAFEFRGGEKLWFKR